MISASKGGAILIVTLFVGFILNYIFNISLGWLLTPEQYGIYGVSVAMLMILTLFISSGFPWAAAKFLSEKTVEEEKRRVFKSTLIGNFFVGSVVSFAFLVIAAQLLPLEEAYAPIILLIMISTMIFSIRATYFGALQGFFMFKEMGLVGLLELFFKILFGVTLVRIGYGAFGALFGFFAGGIITLAVMLYWLRGFHFYKSKGIAGFKVFAFALPMFLVALELTLVQNLDILGVKFLTMQRVSNELAGYYQAVLIIARIPLSVASVIVMVVFPFISRNAYHGSEVYSYTALKFALLFVFPVTIAVATIPEAFIMLIFPKAYLVGARSLSVIALGMGFLAIAQLLSSIFQAQGKATIPAKILMIAVFVQVPLLFVLIPVFGLIGAALATTLACLSSTVLLGWKYLNTNKVSFQLKRTWHLALAYGVMSMALLIFPHTTRIATISSIVTAGLIYFIVLALLGLINPRDIEILLEALPKSRRIIRFKVFVKQAVEQMNGLL